MAIRTGTAWAALAATARKARATLQTVAGEAHMEGSLALAETLSSLAQRRRTPTDQVKRAG
jgi:hypothetical protein